MPAGDGPEGGLPGDHSEDLRGDTRHVVKMVFLPFILAPCLSRASGEVKQNNNKKKLEFLKVVF